MTRCEESLLRLLVATVGLALISVATVANAADPRTLFGVPAVRHNMTPSSATTSRLSEAEAKEYVAVVRKLPASGEWSWESRGGKTLYERQSGVFTYLIAPDGSGFLKIDTTTYPHPYMEQMTLGLDAFTYYGVIVDSLRGDL